MSLVSVRVGARKGWWSEEEKSQLRFPLLAQTWDLPLLFPRPPSPRRAKNRQEYSIRHQSITTALSHYSYPCFRPSSPKPTFLLRPSGSPSIPSLHHARTNFDGQNHRFPSRDNHQARTVRRQPTGILLRIRVNAPRVLAQLLSRSLYLATSRSIDTVEKHQTLLSGRNSGSG